MVVLAAVGRHTVHADDAREEAGVVERDGAEGVGGRSGPADDPGRVGPGVGDP